MMYKVVYNACYGGFGLSDAARYWLKSRGAGLGGRGLRYEIPRHHPLLVECVEALGADASGFCSNLVLREVNGPYRITEFDGYEEVLEPDSPHEWVDPSEV